ncbi:MAG: hypothetical protein ACLRQ0_11305 [Monoglobales bacterium]
MKRLISIIMIAIMILSIIGCSNEKRITGSWEYDVSENNDPDMKGVSLDIREGVMYFSNNINGYEMTLECTYEKDDDTIYVTEISSNGEVMSDEFLEFQYEFLDDKLMLDMEQVDLGKIIFCRADD